MNEHLLKYLLCRKTKVTWIIEGCHAAVKIIVKFVRSRAFKITEGTCCIDLWQHLSQESVSSGSACEISRRIFQ